MERSGSRTRSRVSRSFRNDDKLKQYYLDEVVPTEKTLGTGSYGSVVEVKYQQVSCAAKHIHKLLLDPENVGVEETIEKYRQECQVMAGLRHPNITLFLGLCFLEEFELPLLVMEKLEMSVDDLLECAPTIPPPVKISILADTCSGLVYLHGRPLPIVHRDLTASNVLLTSSLSAKITDMGNSRIVNLQPAQLAKTMSKYPGTLEYMPPEALSDSHRYGTSLDVFSFGHLALYVLTQVFPKDLLSATHIDPHNPGGILARSEVKRREMYMTKLKNQIVESYPVLLEIVTNCLDNDPKRRPTANQLLTRLQLIYSEVEKTYGGNLINVTHVLLTKEIKERDKKIDKIEASQIDLEKDIEELTATNIELEIYKTRLENERNEMKTSIIEVTNEKILLETENDELKSDVRRLMFTKLQIKEEKLQLEFNHKQEKDALKMEVERLTREFQRSTTMSLAKNKPVFPLQVDWRRGLDMPVAASDYIQSVEINGIVYVGGGKTDKKKDGYIVMAYHTQSCQWDTLPLYSARWFAMTAINSKLVLVGGASDSSDSSKLGEWQPNSGHWSHPYPPMPTNRWGPSVTFYINWLIVAGGFQESHLCSCVEILDVQNMQWSTRPSIPRPWSNMKSVATASTWYLMGGFCDGITWVSDVYSVSLEALVSQSMSNSSSIWRKLPMLNCRKSCPFIVGESLMAVGGEDLKIYQPVSLIQHYVPEANIWVQAELLPHAVCQCTCIKTSDKLHVIGGLDGKTRLKITYTSNSI